MNTLPLPIIAEISAKLNPSCVIRLLLTNQNLRSYYLRADFWQLIIQQMVPGTIVDNPTFNDYRLIWSILNDQPFYPRESYIDLLYQELTKIEEDSTQPLQLYLVRTYVSDKYMTRIIVLVLAKSRAGVVAKLINRYSSDFTQLYQIGDLIDHHYFDSQIEELKQRTKGNLEFLPETHLINFYSPQELARLIDQDILSTFRFREDYNLLMGYEYDEYDNRTQIIPIAEYITHPNRSLDDTIWVIVSPENRFHPLHGHFFEVKSTLATDQIKARIKEMTGFDAENLDFLHTLPEIIGE